MAPRGNPGPGSEAPRPPAPRRPPLIGLGYRPGPRGAPGRGAGKRRGCDMRVMAGAVGVFAGALVSAQGRATPDASGWGYFLGLLLGAFGVFIIIRAWPWDGRPLPPPPGGQPAGDEDGNGRRG